eukprot:7644272-Pyramimonas_sp.AAC.1
MQSDFSLGMFRRRERRHPPGYRRHRFARQKPSELPPRPSHNMPPPTWSENNEGCHVYASNGGDTRR